MRCGENLGIANLSPLFEDDLQTPRRKEFCQPCRLVPPPFARAIAYGTYEDELRGLIHLLKYERMQSIATKLGERLAIHLGESAELAADLTVVPVPLHRSKRRQRTFNHAELIARSVVSTLRRTGRQEQIVLAPGLLLRTRATESQASLSPRGRRRNLRGAFAAAHRDTIAGRHILLVDDIYTTGATARAASAALMRAGAASVSVATVARAQREGVALWDANAQLGNLPATAESRGSFATYGEIGRIQPEEI